MNRHPGGKWNRHAHARAAIAALLVLSAILSGMQAAASQTGDEPVILRCAIRPSFETNPLIADSGSWKVLGLIYESPVERNPDTGALIPYIAVGSANESVNRANISWGDCVVGDFGYCPSETWADSTKPEIVIFYDFEGVRWHDGVQMSIRDIIFSFHVRAAYQSNELGHPLKDRGGIFSSNYSETHWLHIEKVWESLDGTRAALRFVLQKPLYSVFEHYLEQYILPYHAWGSEGLGQFVENAQIWCDPGYNRSQPNSWKHWMAERQVNPMPLGSGKFSWGGSDEHTITLKRWAGHFYRSGFKYFSRENRIPMPSLDGIQLIKYTSETSAVLDLESDRIDLIAWNVETSAIAQFSNDPDVAARSLRGTEMRYLSFNMGRASFGYVQDNTHLSPVTRDAGKPIRRAVAHCIDSGSIDAQVTVTDASASSLGTFVRWANISAPSYSFDPPEAINILRKTGYVLTNASLPPGDGNWWLNPDGSQIGSGPGGMIEMLMANSEDDPMTYRIASMIAAQMREIGINAEIVSSDIAILEQRILQSDFDMCILGRGLSAIHRNRPENYLYSAFHSVNTYGSSNPISYRNSTFDRKVELAMAAPALELETRFVRDALASLAFDVPSLDLYYPFNVELYRADNFLGFADDGSGSLLNPLSMSSIRREDRQALAANFMNVPLTMRANETFQLRIRVADQNGDPVPSALVSLETTSGNLSALSGMTDARGIFSANFTAPPVPENYRNGTALMLNIVSASKNGYRDAPGRQALITVFPEGAMLLSVRAAVLQNVVTARDFSGSVGFTYVDIMVTDAKNLPVADASVIIEVEGAAMAPEFRAGLTDDDGYLRLKLTARDTDTVQECAVNITASKVAHVSGAARVSVTVMPYWEPAVVVQPGDSDGWAWAAVPALIVMACAVYLWRRKK
ncbi:MAG: ABC transporter substrate-binding protein [Thermoplasmata archaeon]